MKLRPVSAAVLLLLSSLVQAVAADDVRRPYIVQLLDKPVASYTGDISGLNATQPAPGTRIDPSSINYQLYTDYLGQKQADVKAAVADAPVLYNYNVVLNGFAAMLTDDEVRTLQARTDVAQISPDSERHMVTTSTPTFLGLDAPNGLWSKVGGKSNAGENVIIGIVDGGAWPESLSYADRIDANGNPTFDASGTLAYGNIPSGWNGTCQVGEGFTVANCNRKLIGAQYFNTTFLANQASAGTHWSEFMSPRDSIGGNLGHGGHGTHTSTTAGGNAGPIATIAGFALGTASGIAPRARIAMYKVCWSYNTLSDPTGGKNTCYATDSVAAIEKAVLDGVNVLNFSISGGATVTDPVEQAFLHASNAGVFVAASAGNDGPANAVAHISPWLTTVAASTHNRLLKSDVNLGSGATYSGASMNVTPLPATAMIRAEDAGYAGADAGKLKLCYSAGSNAGVALLDPAKVGGKVVTCTRGDNARVDKSLAVLEAGGVGMVMIDNNAGLVAETHSVPTVHVSAADGAAIAAYAQQANSTAAFTKFVIGTSSVPTPVVASFSSRGPNMYDPNLLKPDLSAPGVDIIAGVTPELSQAQRADVVNGTLVPPTAWASYQGTSMSSPHVAGLGALLHQLYPTWSPAAIKSALMTTGTNTFSDGLAAPQAGTSPWGQGAGHVNPNGATDPGLVYNATGADYKKYMCGAGVTAQCTGGASSTITGYNLNMPSITVSNVLGTVVVNRTVTNVGTATATYNASVTAPAGFSTVVSPPSLTIAPGTSKSFTVSATRTNAVENTWQFGTLAWSDGTHVVKSPISLRSGKQVVAAPLVAADRATATRLLSVTTGFTGRMGVVAGGLKEVTRTASNVIQAPDGTIVTQAQENAACIANSPGVRSFPFTVPANTMLAQFELFNRDTSSTNGGDDLDLVVVDSANNVVGTSGNAGANEAVVLSAPAAGNYKVCVIGYEAANQQSTDFTLSSAIVTAADKGGNFRAAAPAKVYSNTTATIAISWSGLPSGKRYAGAVQTLDLDGAVASTTAFQVQTNGAVPLADPVARAGVKDKGI